MICFKAFASVVVIISIIFFNYFIVKTVWQIILIAENKASRANT